MRLEALFAGIGLGAIMLIVILALVIPGFVADPGPDDPPARLDVTETTLETGEITGETATFEVTSYVQHMGGPAENVSIVVRAIDDTSNLVADSTSAELGPISETGEHAVPLSVTVPREGGYSIETILYVDGDRVDMAQTSIRGLAALTPPHAASTIEFHQFIERPAVEYTITAVADDQATLSVQSYLTNTGDVSESGLELEVTATQADAAVVADRASTTIGSIDPGRTATSDVELTVPDGYNYYLDVTLWRDGVVIDETRAAANLDPQETLDVDEMQQAVEFEAGDFETDPQPDRPPETPEPDVEEQPGFGPLVALAGILVGVVASRRWST